MMPTSTPPNANPWGVVMTPKSTCATAEGEVEQVGDEAGRRGPPGLTMT